MMFSAVLLSGLLQPDRWMDPEWLVVVAEGWIAGVVERNRFQVDPMKTGALDWDIASLEVAWKIHPGWYRLWMDRDGAGLNKKSRLRPKLISMLNRHSTDGIVDSWVLLIWVCWSMLADIPLSAAFGIIDGSWGRDFSGDRCRSDSFDWSTVNFIHADSKESSKLSSQRFTPSLLGLSIDFIMFGAFLFGSGCGSWKHWPILIYW